MQKQEVIQIRSLGYFLFVPTPQDKNQRHFEVKTNQSGVLWDAGDKVEEQEKKKHQQHSGTPAETQQLVQSGPTRPGSAPCQGLLQLQNQVSLALR